MPGFRIDLDLANMGAVGESRRFGDIMAEPHEASAAAIAHLRGDFEQANRAIRANHTKGTAGELEITRCHFEHIAGRLGGDVNHVVGCDQHGATADRYRS